MMYLSAPLQGMADLADLTCLPGFGLDADLDDDDDGDSIAAAAAAGSREEGEDCGGGGSGIGKAAVKQQQLVPSLTRLVLSEGDDHGQLLRLLTGATQKPLVSAAVTQLQHLELNTPGAVPFHALSKLSGLRQLKVLLGEDFQQLAAVQLSSRLQGLTLISRQRVAAAMPLYICCLRQLLQTTTQLTSLALHGGWHLCSDSLMAVYQPLPCLQVLHFSGDVLSHTRDNDKAIDISSNLPETLQQLSLAGRVGGAVPSCFVVDPAKLPQRLSSLTLLGIHTNTRPQPSPVQDVPEPAAAAAAATTTGQAQGPGQGRQQPRGQLRHADVMLCSFKSWQNCIR
jgi:hypothetical protein